jgi:hypothetical protein
MGLGLCEKPRFYTTMAGSDPDKLGSDPAMDVRMLA